MEPIRVLLLSEPVADAGGVRLPRMLRQVLARLITSQGDMELIGPVGGEQDLQQVLAANAADVVVMSCPDGGLPDDGERFLRRQPPLRILGVTPDGRSTVLHELTPVSRRVGDVSPEQLLEAIRGGGGDASPAGASDVAAPSGKAGADGGAG